MVNQELLAALQAIEASVSRLDPAAAGSAGARPGAVVDVQTGAVYEMTDAQVWHWTVALLDEF